MTAERWRRVEDLYHAASERPTADRAAFLAEACSDQELRREVEELLQQSEATENILDHPALRLLDQPEIDIGQTLGPYRIAGLIGSGGMGRVYRAFDTRLGRSVAIKISRAGFTGRFRREARAIAAINHPHICTLYDLGPNYLVMEYIEGSPIRGPMPLPEALKTAIAIADALEAAHRKGVIHRDLKPANILLTASGPKLLDFGLAKLEPEPGAGISDSTTWANTTQATIVGTMQYMSPEQLQGRRADVRSDIFSFGVVLFEMLTGHPAFEADNSASLIAAILTSQPKARKYVPHLPVEVERVLDRALAKDPENRWQSASDLKAALAWIAAPPPKPVRSPDRAAWLLTSFFAFLAAVLAWMQWGPEFSRRLDVTFAGETSSKAPQLLMFDRKGKLLGAAGASADYSNPAVSPDGRRVAVSIRGSSGKRDLWILDLMDGTRSGFSSDPADETNPVWSPDGSEIVYCSDRLGRRDLYIRPASGGPERVILSSRTNKNPLDWSTEGSTVYYNVDRDGGGHDIWMLSLAPENSQPREFLRATESRDWLAVSPDSRWLLYRAGGGSRHIRLRPLISGWDEFPVGGAGSTEGHWRGDGKEFFFISGDTMMAQSVEGAGAQVKLATPAPLFRVPKPNNFGRNAFVVTPDGKRFVIRTGA